MALSIVYVIFIKDILTSRLIVTPEVCKVLEEKISRVPYNEIIIDFSIVRSMSHDFVKKYISMKKGRSDKQIHEVNIPLHLEWTIDYHM
ncbi:hypothetical protein [Candidatus Nitrosocosmicus hydrocola]|uniref:hypothetical protein n=1 Tax=Candidatus Nitrosocosmicus hydrocola TaxID=1826872 RepID=UPI0011E59A5F|nr:hypothetical protein [Candidatus Nitrosocosmicus hydrocola]